MVVANRGNVEVVEETSLQLTIWPPGQAVLSRDLTVPPLAPGEKTTVTFFELAVTPDTTYQVEVRLGLAQEEQNVRRQQLRVHPERRWMTVSLAAFPHTASSFKAPSPTCSVLP